METQTDVEDAVLKELKTIFPNQLESFLRGVRSLYEPRKRSDKSKAEWLQGCVNHIITKLVDSKGGDNAAGSPAQSSSTVSSPIRDSNNGITRNMIQKVEDMFPDADRPWIVTSLIYTKQCFSNNPVDRTCNYMLEYPNRYMRKSQPSVSSPGPTTPKLSKQDSTADIAQPEKKSNVLSIDRELLGLDSDSSDDDDILPSVFSYRYKGKITQGSPSATVTSVNKLRYSSEISDSSLVSSSPSVITDKSRDKLATMSAVTSHTPKKTSRDQLKSTRAVLHRKIPVKRLESDTSTSSRSSFRFDLHNLTSSSDTPNSSSTKSDLHDLTSSSYTPSSSSTKSDLHDLTSLSNTLSSSSTCKSDLHDLTSSSDTPGSSSTKSDSPSLILLDHCQPTEILYNSNNSPTKRLESEATSSSTRSKTDLQNLTSSGQTQVKSNSSSSFGNTGARSHIYSSLCNTLASSSTSSVSDTETSNLYGHNSHVKIEPAAQSQSLSKMVGRTSLSRSLSGPPSTQLSTTSAPVFRRNNGSTVSSTSQSFPPRKSPLFSPGKSYKVDLSKISPDQRFKLARKLSALKGNNSPLEIVSSSSQLVQTKKRLWQEGQCDNNFNGQFIKKTSAHPRPVPLTLSNEPVSSSMQFETPPRKPISAATKTRVGPNKRESERNNLASNSVLSTHAANTHTSKESVDSVTGRPLKKTSNGMTSLKRTKLLKKVIAACEYHKDEQHVNKASVVSAGITNKLDPLAHGSRGLSMDRSSEQPDANHSAAIDRAVFNTLMSTSNGKERWKQKLEYIAKYYRDKSKLRRNPVASGTPAVSKPITQSNKTSRCVEQPMKSSKGCSVAVTTVSPRSTPNTSTSSHQKTTISPHQTTAYQCPMRAAQHNTINSQPKDHVPHHQATSSQHQATSSQCPMRAAQHKTMNSQPKNHVPYHQATSSQHQATSSQCLMRAAQHKTMNSQPKNRVPHHQATSSQHQVPTSSQCPTEAAQHMAINSQAKTHAPSHQTTSSQHQVPTSQLWPAASLNHTEQKHCINGLSCSSSILGNQEHTKRLLGIAYCKPRDNVPKPCTMNTVLQPSKNQGLEPSDSRGQSLSRSLSQPNVKFLEDSGIVYKCPTKVESTIPSSTSLSVGSLPGHTNVQKSLSDKNKLIFTIHKDCFSKTSAGKERQIPWTEVSSQVRPIFNKEPQNESSIDKPSKNSLASLSTNPISIPSLSQASGVVQHDQRQPSQSEELVSNHDPDNGTGDLSKTNSGCKSVLWVPKNETSFKMPPCSNTTNTSPSNSGQGFASDKTSTSRLNGAAKTIVPDLICTGVTCSNSNTTSPSTSNETTKGRLSACAVDKPLLCNVTEATVSPKSQDVVHSPDSTFKPLQVIKEDATSSETTSLMCEGCSASFDTVNIYQCCDGHVICTKCVEKGAKQVLSGENSGSGVVICPCSGCSSSVPRDNLARALPSMIMDLLDEKWTKENLLAIGQSNDLVKCPHCDFAALVDGSVEVFQCLKESCGISSCRHCHGVWGEGKHEKCGKKEESSTGETTMLIKKVSNEGSSSNEDYPSHWTETKSTGKIYVQKLVQPSTKEWADVRNLLAKTLPEAKIRYINRVQNYRLWRKYSVTKQNILEDNGEEDLNERFLFHGTRETVVESICRDGFDWRMCGRHGVVYGQGAYFARTAMYSHRYSSLPNSFGVNMLNVHQLGFGGVSWGPTPVVSSSSRHSGGAHVASGLTSATILGFTHGQALHIGNSYQTGTPTSSGNLLISSGLGLPTPVVKTGTSPTVIVAGKAMQRKSSVSGPSLTQLAPSPAHLAVAGPSSTTRQSQSGQQASNNNQYTMFLARVLVGRSAQGKRGYRKPPVIPGFSDGRTYDSCVDNAKIPQIFVIFDTSQAYPEYVITYTL